LRSQKRKKKKRRGEPKKEEKEERRGGFDWRRSKVRKEETGGTQEQKCQVKNEIKTPPAAAKQS